MEENMITETYTWNQKVYDQLLESMQLKSYFGIDNNPFGVIIQVEKKFDDNDNPYIEVQYAPACE